jgi:hypothetical protein
MREGVNGVNISSVVWGNIFFWTVSRKINTLFYDFYFIFARYGANTVLLLPKGGFYFYLLY